MSIRRKEPVSQSLGCCLLTDEVTRRRPSREDENNWRTIFGSCCLLDGGGDAEVPDARGRELAGVQVGDVLHDLVKGINVVALYSQRGLVGVELHLGEEIKETV